MSLYKPNSVYITTKRQCTASDREFKQLGAVFTSDGRQNIKID